MRIWGRTIAAVIILLVAGCAGSGGVNNGDFVFLSPLAGSALTGVTIDQMGDLLTLTVDEVPPAGVFLRANLSLPRSVSAELWQGDQDVIRLVAPTPKGIDVGIVPLADYHGGKVVLSLMLGDPVRAVSRPPSGSWNAVRDLTVEPVAEGVYRLTWTEINVGDYNANGLVGVSDLTPIGIYYNRWVGLEGAPRGLMVMVMV